MMGVSAADANTLWVVDVDPHGKEGGIILHSTDRGQSWDRKTPPTSPGRHTGEPLGHIHGIGPLSHTHPFPMGNTRLLFAAGGIGPVDGENEEEGFHRLSEHVSVADSKEANKLTERIFH